MLMNFVHEELKCGRCRSVSQALQIVKKDRKTVDRFKHIYYLNATEPEVLKQVHNSFDLKKNRWLLLTYLPILHFFANR